MVISNFAISHLPAISVSNFASPIHIGEGHLRAEPLLDEGVKSWIY